MSSYAKILDDGSYEYGIIEINRTNRRKDRMVKIGVVADYEAARRAIGNLAN